MAAYKNERAPRAKRKTKQVMPRTSLRSAADTAGISFREIINQNPMLSPDESRALIKKKGTAEWPAAREKLILGNLKLVVSVAKKYAWLDGCSMDDIVSHGIIGMMKALDRYDPTVETTVATYAVYWIEASINDELLYQQSLIRNPAYVEKLLLKLGQYQRQVFLETGAKASVAALAKMMEMPEEKVHYLLKLQHRNVASLDDSVGASAKVQVRDSDGEDDLFISEVVPSAVSVEEEVVRRITLRQVTAAIRKLKPFEQKVIALRFGFVGGEPLTLQQCAKKLDCSDESIRRALASAIRKLQDDYLAQNK